MSEFDNKMNEICKSIHMQGILGGFVLIGLYFILYMVLLGGSFEDAFYGINRVYLMFLVAGAVIVIVSVGAMVFKVDQKKIRRAAKNQGIIWQQLERDLNQGTVFYQKGSADLIVLSDGYGLVRSKSSFHIIRSSNIMKIGIDYMNVGQNQFERMNCLMRDGSVYPIQMKHYMAMQVAEYLKQQMQPEPVTAPKNDENDFFVLTEKDR